MPSSRSRPSKLPIAPAHGRAIVHCSTRACAPPQASARASRRGRGHVERERSRQVASGPAARLRALRGGRRGGGAAAASGQVGCAQGGGRQRQPRCLAGGRARARVGRDLRGGAAADAGLGQAAGGRAAPDRDGAADHHRRLRRVPGAAGRRHPHEPGRDRAAVGARRAALRDPPLRGAGRRPHRCGHGRRPQGAPCRDDRSAAGRHHLRRHRPRRDAHRDAHADAPLRRSRGAPPRARMASAERVHPLRDHHQARRARRVRSNASRGVRRPGPRQGGHVPRLRGTVARLHRRRLAWARAPRSPPS